MEQPEENIDQARNEILVDLKSTFGEFSPLDSLEQLLSWQPRQDYVSRELYVPYERLSKDRAEGMDSQTNKILCCHDMKGGYLDDRYVMGASDAEGYTFRHWNVIDGFVYFSHRFVTIPPPGWTNISHKHGCPIYGTIITEWDDGEKLCTELLSSQAKLDRSVQQLVNIALYYRFDGWIINIENELHQELVEKMLEFVKMLTEAMHRAIPHAKVIWYDAVTVEGKLEWQNGLTKLNKPFFDNCDGIWINYAWKEGDPNRMRDAAGDRKDDVFIGVDCFGRGTYGGGGLNTYVAVEAIKNSGMNVALFGCCWPYQHYLEHSSQYPDADGEANDNNNSLSGPLAEIYESWYVFDEEFWYRIEKVWKRRRCTVTSLPFSSDFSIGSGFGYYSGGELCGINPWYNLSLQSIQSTPWVYDSHHTNIFTCHISNGTAFNRANCLVVKGGVGDSIRIRLYQTYIPLFGKSGISLRCTSALSKGIGLRISLKISRNLEDQNKPKETIVVELDCTDDRACSTKLASSGDHQPTFSSTILVKFPSKELKSGQVVLNERETNLTDVKPLEGCPWMTSEFGIPSIDLPSWVFEEGIMTNIDAIIRPLTSGSMCKCHVAIGNLSAWFLQESFPPCPPVGAIIPENVNLRFIYQDDDPSLERMCKRISLSLIWDAPQNVHRFQVWMRTAKQQNDQLAWKAPEFLRAVSVPMFVVSDKDLSLDVVAVRFHIVTEMGPRAQPFRSARSTTLTFPEISGELTSDPS